MNYISYPGTVEAEITKSKIDIIRKICIDVSKEHFYNYKPSEKPKVEPYNPDWGVEEFEGEGRYVPYVFARQLTYYFLVKHSKNTLSSIADYTNKTHATVIHGNRKIANLKRYDKFMRPTILKAQRLIDFVVTESIVS